MPTNYDGIPGNVSFTAPLAISSTSTGATVTVTVSGALPADFLTGVVVDITGVVGNAGTNVNGVHVATVTGASTFTIPVASSGTYSSGGTVQPLNMTPLYTVPSDGDPDNAASIFPSLSALGDRTQFLASATGVAKLAGQISYSQSDPGNATTWAARSVTAVAATWYALNPSAGTLLGITSQEGCLTPSSGQPPISVDGWYPSLDCGVVSLTADAFTGSAVPARFGLWYAVGPTGGAVPSFPASYLQVAYTSTYVIADKQTISLRGLIPHTSAGGTLYLQPAVYSLGLTGSVDWGLWGDTSLVIQCWRSTGAGQ